MNEKIKIGIVGYGNLGRGAELAISQHSDMELVGIFTRRDPLALCSDNNKFFPFSEILNFKDKIDVMILCGGSAKDLDEQGPMVSKDFNTVDSFDNHGRIPEYFDKINKISTSSNTLSLISVGWDPGLFSMNRLLGEAILPQGNTYTFWGNGLSQGHSDAIRRVKGVKAGVQYTMPIKESVDSVSSGNNIDMPANQGHKRICYICCDENEDFHRIENEIKTMPNYFADYHTEVNFISLEELEKDHSKMPHGGFVILTATTGSCNKEKIEFNLALESNPEFTSSVLVAYARAIHKLSKEGRAGALSIFDIPLGYLSPKSPEDLRRELL